MRAAPIRPAWTRRSERRPSGRAERLAAERSAQAEAARKHAQLYDRDEIEAKQAADRAAGAASIARAGESRRRAAVAVARSSVDLRSPAARLAAEERAALRIAPPRGA